MADPNTGGDSWIQSHEGILTLNPEGNNVGIGTPTPLSTLHVAVPSSSAPISALTIDVQDYQSAANAAASHSLRVRTVGAGVTHFFIRGDGNVGIGTAQPMTALHIPLQGLQVGFSSVPTDNFHLASDLNGPRALRFYNKNFGSGTPLLSITPEGNLGIGTTAPSHPLHVNSILGIRQNRLYLSGGDKWSSLSYNAHHNTANNGWVFPDPSRPAATIEMDDSHGSSRFQVWTTARSAETDWKLRFHIDGENGNVGIGTSSPSPKYRLHVIGRAHASGGFDQPSDLRLKANITPLTGVLAKLQHVRGVSFDWNETYAELGPMTGQREIGVIAQEIEQVFPELVTRGAEEEYRSVDYGRLTAILIEAIKELKREKDADIAALRADPLSTNAN